MPSGTVTSTLGACVGSIRLRFGDNGTVPRGDKFLGTDWGNHACLCLQSGTPQLLNPGYNWGNYQLG